jgi:hypothetical protein
MTEDNKNKDKIFNILSSAHFIMKNDALKLSDTEGVFFWDEHVSGLSWQQEENFTKFYYHTENMKRGQVIINYDKKAPKSFHKKIKDFMNNLKDYEQNKTYLKLLSLQYEFTIIMDTALEYISFIDDY